MPLPRAGNAQEQEYLDRLYDEYCKISLRELIKMYEKTPITHHHGWIAQRAHEYATAMLNERNKK